MILRIKSNELLSHTLDEIEGWISEYMIWLFARLRSFAANFGRKND